jgi:hypothetical protein
MITDPREVLAGVEKDLLDSLSDKWTDAKQQSLVGSDAVEFVNFAKDWLAKNRPVEIQCADMNYIIRFSNGERCLISPRTGAEGGGEMQMSTYIPMTPNYQQFVGGMQPANAVPVTPWKQ